MNGNCHLGLRAHSPPYVDRIRGIRGSYHNLPKAIFHLLKRDNKLVPWQLFHPLGVLASQRLGVDSAFLDLTG